MLESPGNEFDQAIDTQARIQKLNHLFETESGLLAPELIKLVHELAECVDHQETVVDKLVERALRRKPRSRIRKP